MDDLLSIIQKLRDEVSRRNYWIRYNITTPSVKSVVIKHLAILWICVTAFKWLSSKTLSKPYAYLPQCLAHSRHILNIVELNQSVNTPHSEVGGHLGVSENIMLACYALILPSLGDVHIKIVFKFRKDIWIGEAILSCFCVLELKGN